MKKSLILFGLCIISLWACKRDKDPVPTTLKFEDITRETILANKDKIDQDVITYNSPNGSNFKVGSIVFFKTNAGNYGKLKVLSLNEAKQLVLQVVVYAENGSVIADKASFSPEFSPSTAYDFDIDTFPVAGVATADFLFYISNGIDSLIWADIARGYIYSV